MDVWSSFSSFLKSDAESVVPAFDINRVNIRSISREKRVAAPRRFNSERPTNMTKGKDTFTEKVRRKVKGALERKKDDRKNETATGALGAKVYTAHGRVKYGARERAADEVIDLEGPGPVVPGVRHPCCWSEDSVALGARVH